MVRSNKQVLSGGKSYKNNLSKKHGIEEVLFNKDSRLEYLTGFHKRKLERQKKAQEFNKEQERQQKIEERKRVRSERKKDIEAQMHKFKETMKEVGDYIGSENESDTDSWRGFSDDESKHEVRSILKKCVDVYTDDTTVDIEQLEPNENFEFLAKANNVELENSKRILDESIDRAKKYAKFLGVDNKLKKKKKFRYLTKSERKNNQRKANANKRRK